MHVLVVEDHPINQQLVLELLRGMGVIADLAQHGQDAIEMLAAREPDYFIRWCSWICRCRCSTATRPPSACAGS